MSSRTLLLACACALVFLGFVWWRSDARSEAGLRAGPSLAVEQPPAAVVEIEGAELAPASVGRRAPLAAEPSSTASTVPTPAAATPAAEQRGSVRDVAGRPLEGLGLFRASDLVAGWPPAGVVPLAISDEAGLFVCKGGAWVDLRAESAEWTTVLPGNTRNLPVVIVAAPRRHYAGIAIDEHGERLAGVALEVELDPGRARALVPGEVRSGARSWSAQSGQDGSFALTDVGWMSDLTLRGRLAGFVEAELRLADESRDDLELTLAHPAPTERSLAGTVVDGEGRAAPGAEVLLEDGPRTMSDRDGRFLLDAPPELERGLLWATKTGHLPARLELAPLAPYLGPTPGEPIALVLGGAPLAIAGRVVDAGGAGVPEAWVFTWDMTRRAGHRSVEHALSGGGGLRTDADGEGRFRLEGLLPRAYTLLAMHPITLEVATLENVAAGSEDVRLVLTRLERARRVAGHVRTPSGEPVAGVMIFCGRESAPGVQRVFSPLVTDRTPVTDGEGAFAFEALCVEGAYLLPASGGIADQERVLLDSTLDLEHLELVASRVCRFQLELASDPDEADTFGVLDGAGKVMRVGYELGNTSVSGNTYWPLAGGRSEVMQCDERAASLALRKAGVEVRRVPIQLRPDGVQVVRL